jgi:hypothetical protein
MPVNLKQKSNGDFAYRSGAEGPVIGIEIYYSKGGGNVWSGGNDPRGIWGLIRPMKLERGMQSFCITDGKRFFIKPLARKSDKALLDVVEQLDSAIPGIAAKYEENHEAGLLLFKQTIDIFKVCNNPIEVKEPL